MIDFNSLFKYKSLINLWTPQIIQSSCCDCTCTAAGLHKSLYDCSLSWVNAIYGLSNQLTFRSYAYYAFQIYVFIIDCISGEMFILVTNFFRRNQVFLDSNQNIQLWTSHYCQRRCFFLYHSTRNFRNYFVSWGNSLSLGECEFNRNPGCGGATSII